MGTKRFGVYDGVLVLAGMMPALAVHGAAADAIKSAPETVVTASRLGEGVTGASTTIITAEEIERSPGQSLQDVLERLPGVQVQNLFGGVNGAGAVVDMRGFGAAAAPNTLVLINGRRLNDVDLSGVDYGAIPRASIERIEVTRGNSGAVLYGDGAVGGVINIVTKNGFNEPTSARAEGGLGSFGHREGNASVSRTIGSTAFSVYGNAINSDGYRINNELRQRNVVGEVRQSVDNGELYLNLSADTQHLGLPGARQVTLAGSELDTDRKGTSTPADYADKQGLNAAFGGTHQLRDGLELVVDAGVRHKEQQSAFFSAWGPAFNTYTETALTTFSLTPRVNVEHRLFGLSGKAITGIDLYRSAYESDRMVNQGDASAHRYRLEQRILAGYLQDTVSLRPGTDASFGLRVQNADTSARDRFDPGAPNPGSPVQGVALDNNETQYAFHVGLEHRLDDSLALFGRAGRSMRLPTVDERVGGSPWGTAINFDLKPQTSRDVEAGLRGRWGAFGLQSSAYLMELRDELHYSPATFTNINLDPTRRYGVENAATYRLSETVRLRGGLTYTRAQFTEGAWKGNDVPLVSRWTGSAGASWDIWDNLAVLDVDARYVGERRFDNDQANFQPTIPSHALVDLRLGGAADWAHWSLAVQNLFDQKYFDYGIASSSTYGTYNAYPMPGRTVMARFGMSF